MKWVRPIAVGIDVGLTDVRMVVITQRDRQSVVTASAVGLLPDDTIKEGVLQDPRVFTKVLQRLRRQCRVPAHTRVGLSVYGLPSVLKVVQAPEQDVDDMSTYVDQEVRSCFSRSAEDMITEYGLVGDRDQPDCRILGAGYDERVLCQYIEALERASLRIARIEPAFLGIMRCICDTHLRSCEQSRQMLLILRDAEIQLGVLEAGVLEAIEIRSIRGVLDNERHLSVCLVREIHHLIQQYEGEVRSNAASWQILIVADHQRTLPAVVQWNIKKTLPDAKVDVVDRQVVSSLLPTRRQVVFDAMSSLALGMAMKREALSGSIPSINLLPPTVIKLKQAKRRRVLASYAAAIVMVAMINLAPVISVRADKIRDEIVQAQFQCGCNEMTSLIDRCSKLEDRIEGLQVELRKLTAIKHERRSLDWKGLLKEVRDSLPDHLWLTRLEAWQDKGALIIEGRSATYNAIDHYLNALEQCEIISQAEVIDRDLSINGEAVVFSVCCYLSVPKKAEDIPL